MKTLLIIFTCLTALLSATDKMRIFDDTHPLTPRYKTSEYQKITSVLNSVGIRFEKWDANKILNDQASEQEIFDAYREDIEKLQRENNYSSVDVVSMSPNSARREELRNKFLNEHTHTEDEVRFFVEGSGLFYLHIEKSVIIVLCEKGDLISIPAHCTHWFDMGKSPHFTAIRFFTDPSGWIAKFTNSQISEQFQRFNE